jgi:hypothetical protein
MAEYKKPNTMKMADSFRVMKWLEKAWPVITKERWTLQHAAEVCNKDLEITVTWVNIRNRAQDLGKKWPRGSGFGSGSGKRKDRTAFLAKQILIIADWIGNEFGAETEIPIDRESLQSIVNHGVSRSKTLSEGENNGQV